LILQGCLPLVRSMSGFSRTTSKWWGLSAVDSLNRAATKPLVLVKHTHQHRQAPRRLAWTRTLSIPTTDRSVEPKIRSAYWCAAHLGTTIIRFFIDHGADRIKDSPFAGSGA
jgi:hypothetical protein